MARRINPTPKLANRPMRPSFEARPVLELVEHPPTDRDQAMFLGASNSYFRRYSLGECSVIVTREFGKWHLSIAHPRRYPTWDEIAAARYRILLATVTMAMILPPVESYINLHENCFQLIEIPDPEA